MEPQQTSPLPGALPQPGGVGEAGLLHELFLRAARAHAELVALEIPASGPGRHRRTLSYAELERTSSAIARELGHWVNEECVVAVLLPRDSPRLLAAQLGILRAGAAWLSLDPDYPAEHLNFLITDACAAVVLTDAAGSTHAGLAEWPSERIARLDRLALAAGEAPPPAWLTPASLAYVIYTSGTTGRPKGVLIEHRAVANLIASDLAEFALGPGDRVAQSSAAVYDSSIEETWLALACGATSVVLDDETVRSGPDLVPWLVRERISVFCPPPTLLRAMGCDDPRAALPDVRLLYVGGEALPQVIADRWAPGRRLENGYGPTECAITVLRTQVRAGEPVTIGRPVPGNQAWILDESLEEVRAGAAGELCIGGVALARGYLGRDELTEERFTVHARLGRLYRTGDLVQRDERGNVHYLGRIDAQVKLRGHRIELGAVEAALERCAGVRSAACRVQGEGTAQLLAAFVVPRDGRAAPDWPALEARLRELLPAPMVPSRFAVLDTLPTSRSGKLDRAALPVIAAPPRTAGGATARDPLERAIADAVRTALQLRGDVAIDGDFFLDLGGTSIAAAEVVSLLRAAAATAAIAVRDVYELRTIAALAERLRTARVPTAPRVAAAPRRRARPAPATLVQLLWLALELFVGSSVAYLVFFDLVPFLLRRLGLVPSVLVAPLIGVALALLYVPASVAVLVVAKRLLIGRYRAAREPVWGSFYVRNWIVQQCAAAVPWGALQDTPLVGVVLRCLGARVGRRVHIHRGVDLRQGGWDLLAIGDDVSLGQDVSLRLVELDDGHVVVGPVTIGDGATLEVRAGVEAGAVVGEGAFLDPLTWLPAGARVPPAERWSGTPARPVGAAPEPTTVASAERELSPLAQCLQILAVRAARAYVGTATLALLVALVCLFAPEVDRVRVLSWMFSEPLESTPLGVLAALAVAAGPLGVLVSGLGLRALGRVQPGALRRFGPRYAHVLLSADVVQGVGTLLSGTLFWPIWLRLAGMRIGRKCEISSIVDVVPGLVEIGEESFFADGIYLGGPRVHRGVVTLAETRIGSRSFLGNHVVVPAGAQLPDAVLFGVCTVADGSHVRAGSSWFGHPAFELPRREVVEVGRELTHDPSTLRYATRLVWESARFLLPVPPLLGLFAWLRALAYLSESWSPVGFHLLAVPLVTAGLAAAFVLAVLVLKWSLLGRVKPGQHPLWSCWCSRWDFLYVAWNLWARATLARLEGTLLLQVFLRAVGVKIGRGVTLGSGFAQVVDPDMLHFEDDATVACNFQAHSFEDRVLKIDRVHVRRAATVMSDAVLLYGADIGERAHVAPQSVVMKRERLTAGRAYAGAPTEPLD